MKNNKSIESQKKTGKQPDADVEESKIPVASYDKNENWVKEYFEQFGREPSFFWSYIE